MTFLDPRREQKDINAKFVVFLEMLLRICWYLDVRQRLDCILLILRELGLAVVVGWFSQFDFWNKTKQNVQKFRFLNSTSGLSRFKTLESRQTQCAVEEPEKLEEPRLVHSPCSLSAEHVPPRPSQCHDLSHSLELKHHYQLSHGDPSTCEWCPDRLFCPTGNRKEKFYLFFERRKEWTLLMWRLIPA